MSVVPDVPAIAETLPGYEVISWYGLFTTAGTPQAVVARLNRETVAAVNDPALAVRLSALGLEPETGTPEASSAWVRSEHAKWGKPIRALDLRL